VRLFGFCSWFTRGLAANPGLKLANAFGIFFKLYDSKNNKELDSLAAAGVYVPRLDKFIRSRSPEQIQAIQTYSSASKLFG
jgi:hypothetical protein